jgi:Rod binding domain-containing protein
MNVAALQPHINAADIPPELLSDNKQLTEDQKVGEVARQFEAILLRQILESTQKTVIPSKFSDNSTAASIYHDLVTHQLADSISKSGTLGLAKTLQHQLTRQLHPASTAGHDRQPEALPTAHAGSGVARPPSCPGPAQHPSPATADTRNLGSR